MASESHNQILKGLLHLNDGKCPGVKGLVLGPEGQWVEALVNKGHHILPDRSMEASSLPHPQTSHASRVVPDPAAGNC